MDVAIIIGILKSMLSIVYVDLMVFYGIDNKTVKSRC